MRRLTSVLTTAAITMTLPVHATGVAAATHQVGSDSTSSNLPTLVAAVAEANQRVADLGADIQGRQEAMNKALVDTAAARQTLATMQHELALSEQAVLASQTDIENAQGRFDQFAASMYVNGPPAALPLARSPEDILRGAATQQTLALSFGRVKDTLHRTQTQRANRLSDAKAARQRADDAAAEAQQRQDAAVTELAAAQQTFAAQQQELNTRVAERNSAQAQLSAARQATTATTPPPGRTPTGSAQLPSQWDISRRPLQGTHDAGLWDTTLPMVPSANVTGDPIAIINAVLQIMATSLQLTADMGRKFLTKLGIISPAAAATDPGITNGRIPLLYGQQASEAVIRRAMSQLGVPYSWGGGNANGPSRGIDQGANTVGFDCSGLMLYAFAGVGIKLDHYSGSQYNAGRKIPSAQMRRGDLIFYGPNASQHEAMYLGDGMMIEAPYTGSVVRISPVRTSGMTPYVTRLIEY